MKRLLAMALIAFCGFAHSQSGTSPNLVNVTNTQGTGWVGTTPYSGNGGGLFGGSSPGYNAETNSIIFGYNQGVAAYTYAFSTALQNSGMTITGYNYSWQYLNQDMSSGVLNAKVNFGGVDGSALHTKYWNLGTTNGWTAISGTEAFANAGLLASSIANFSLTFSGKDNRWWAGYYGPQVRDPSLSLNYTFDQCASNPLSSPSCAGYASAYHNQQCTANPLYSTTCSGYAAAYFTQQCTINSLYSPDCPGYAAAYLNYQCSVNPLYATTCAGYETAYFNQRCSESALYNTRCTGYDQAYQSQQCSINPLYSTTCSGYAGAYHDQQCSLNPLYATTCSGYAQAYFSQQCSLNGLYDQRCSNYAEAYAKKMLLEQQKIASTVAVAGQVAAVAQADPAKTTTTTPTVETVSVSPAATATAIVPVAKTEPAASPVAAISQPTNQEAPKQSAQQQEQKPTQPTTRQQLTERRQAAARAEAVEKGKNLAGNMGKVADMEAQKQIQNVVMQAIGFTPGFDAYNKALVPDAVGYKPFTVYSNQKTVDNRRLGMGLYGPSDRLHNDLVNSQYIGN